MLGSIFAEAIMDKNFFLPIMGTTLFLTLLNALITMLTFYSHSVEYFVKGHPAILIQNGTISWKAMKQNFITKRELMHEVHAQLHTNDIEKIKLAFLEADGTFSFILKEHK